MLTVHLVGASHGKKIAQAFKRLPGYGTVFQVRSLCESGKTFYDLKWPALESLKETDFLVILPFGNDLIERKYIKRIGSKIHLLNFRPRQSEYFEERYRVLQEKIDSTVARVCILTSFYRHFCCNDHFYSGWVGYQNKVNRDLTARFEGTRVRTLDHRRLIGLPYRKSKDLLEYRKLQTDSVHFSDYRPIAEGILRCAI